MIALLFASWAFAAGPTTLLCQVDGGGTEKPKLVMKAGGGHTLFVCGNGDLKNALTGLRIFAVNQAGKKASGHVFQGEEVKKYTAQPKGPALLLQELLLVGSEKFPAFETKIECDGLSCRAGEANCIFKGPKYVPKDALVRVKQVMRTPGGKGASAKLIEELASLAYYGNKEAQGIFENRGNLSLDGTAGEKYFDHQTALQRLRHAGCLSSR